MTEAEWKTVRSHKKHPITGELWSVCCEEFEKIDRVITALYRINKQWEATRWFLCYQRVHLPTTQTMWIALSWDLTSVNVSNEFPEHSSEFQFSCWNNYFQWTHHFQSISTNIRFIKYNNTVYLKIFCSNPTLWTAHCGQKNSSAINIFLCRMTNHIHQMYCQLSWRWFSSVCLEHVEKDMPWCGYISRGTGASHAYWRESPADCVSPSHENLRDFTLL